MGKSSSVFVQLARYVDMAVIKTKENQHGASGQIGNQIQMMLWES